MVNTIVSVVAFCILLLCLNYVRHSIWCDWAITQGIIQVKEATQKLQLHKFLTLESSERLEHYKGEEE